MRITRFLRNDLKSNLLFITNYSNPFTERLVSSSGYRLLVLEVFMLQRTLITLAHHIQDIVYRRTETQRKRTTTVLLICRDFYFTCRLSFYSVTTGNRYPSGSSVAYLPLSSVSLPRLSPVFVGAHIRYCTGSAHYCIHGRLSNKDPFHTYVYICHVCPCMYVSLSSSYPVLGDGVNFP